MSKGLIEFSHKGDQYRLNWSGAGYTTPASLGCHLSIVSGFGSVSLGALSKLTEVEGVDWEGKKQTRKVWKEVASPGYDGWGVYKDAYGAVRDAFQDKKEVLKDLIYSDFVKNYLPSAGGVLFSAPVNRGSISRPSPLNTLFTQPGWEHFTFSPPAFAAWLAKHPECGKIYATPVFANPNHNYRTDWSMSQAWIWIPPKYVWSICTDWGIPEFGVPKDEKLTSKGVIKHFAEKFGIDEKQAEKEISLTYF